MPIDQSRFPLVFLRSELDAEAASTHDHSAEAQLEAVLDRQERFVLITDHSPGDEQGDSVEERRQRALFFKRNKGRLRRFCAGAIVIEGDRPTPMPMRLAAQAMGKAFGIGFHFVASEAEAIERGVGLVGQAAGSIARKL